MSLVERLLNLVANKEDIVNDDSLYLRRWRLFGYNAKLPYLFGRGVMIHRIVRPDADRDPHNHPWDFWSLVLKGSYIEDIYHGVYTHRGRLEFPAESITRVARKFGALDWRPAEHMHRIDKLPDGDAWTLVVVKRRTDHKWGFWTPRGWVYWKEYITAKQDAGVVISASKSPS